MLLVAWWKPGKHKGKDISRGSFPSSLNELSKETDLTENELRTAIKHLKSTGEITSKSYNKFTVFTIKNYDLYQSDNEQNYTEITSKITGKSQADNKQLTGKSQAINKQITNLPIIKEIKKEIREEDKKERTEEDTPPISPLQGETVDNLKSKSKPKKKEQTVYYPNDEQLDEAFKEFLVMRNKIKKPLATQKALARMMNKLDRLSAGDNDLAVRILNQSTDHCWQDVYELKDGNNSQRQPFGNGGIDWSKV